MASFKRSRGDDLDDEGEYERRQDSDFRRQMTMMRRDRQERWRRERSAGCANAVGDDVQHVYRLRRGALTLCADLERLAAYVRSQLARDPYASVGGVLLLHFGNDVIEMTADEARDVLQQSDELARVVEQQQRRQYSSMFSSRW